MEKNKADEKLLATIETQAQWDEYVGNFIRDYSDIFIKHQIPIGFGLLAWQINALKNEVIDVENKLDELIEAVKESQ